MSDEIVPSPYRQGYESVTNPSQRAYVDQLLADAEALPGEYLPPGIADRDKFISYYCLGYEEGIKTAAALGIPPLRHKDVFQPEKANSVEKFIEVANVGSGEYVRYESYTDPQYRRTSYYESSRRESQNWEQSFIGYNRRRYIFHATFMQSIVNEGEPDQQALEAFMQNLRPVHLPHTYAERPDNSGDLYNKTEWLTASLLSALTLPPDKCTAGMKRRAIELYAAVVDDEQLQRPDQFQKDCLSGFSGIKKWAEERGLVRLPWSMRLSSSELRYSTHPQWTDNVVYRQYFGETSDNVEGLGAFLQDHAMDYVQILLLRTFGKDYGPIPLYQALQEMVATARLTPEIKDIIFNEKASFNTLYDQSIGLLPEHQLGLTELLGHLPETSEETWQQLAGQLALQAQALTGKNQELQGKVAALEQQIIRLEQQPPQVVYQERPRTYIEELHHQHGISPAASDEGCELYVGAIRAHYIQKHGPEGPDPNPEGLAGALQELDEILRIRNITPKLGPAG